MQRERKVAQRRKAFVTGASRGIGKTIAIRLAQGGFDVAITARTIEEGEQREHSSTVKKSDTTPLPGSLTSTADAVRAAGGGVLVLPADLLDRGSLGAAATTVLERWAISIWWCTTPVSSVQDIWISSPKRRSKCWKNMCKETLSRRWC
jgi:NAD(P)-dependent dehydrogenase (short-subunit alcohol dehydrogenase family)